MTLHARSDHFLLIDLSIEIVTVALFALHSCLDLSQLTLTSQQLLSLLVNLSLDLDFDFAELLLFTTQLLFLETD